MLFSDEDKILIKKQGFDKNCICNQYGERLAILNTENVKICVRITKLEAIKMQLVCISAIPAEYQQKFELLISQGSVATCLR